jgi:hypothetical protein
MNREWNSSGVMREFVKVATESGLIISDLQQKELVGNADEDTPVKDHRRYEPTEEYELDVEGGNLVGKAHPEQAWTARQSAPVKSMGEGSLVENIEEQQKKDIEVATKMPTGALFGIHASVVSDLVKLANKLDEDGRHKEAIRIDQAIERLGRLPFVDSRLRKEGAAWLWPVVMLVSAVAPMAWNRFFNKGTVTTSKGKIDEGKGRVTTKTKAPMSRGGKAMTAIGLGLSALFLLGKKITSVEEGIRTDTQDLYDVLKKAAPESSAAAAAAAKLAPYVSAFSKKPKNAAEYEQYKSKAKALKNLLPGIKNDIENVLNVDLESGLWTWTGLDLRSRIEEKLNTWESGLEELKSKGVKVENKAKATITPISKKLSGISGLQQILMNEGLLTQSSGALDSQTVQAVSKLGIRLDRDINTLYERRIIAKKPKSGFQGKILRDGKLSMSPETLSRILNLVKRLINTPQK